MTSLTQRTVSAVIEANSILFQLYSLGDRQSSGAARHTAMEFTQSIMALTQASISGPTEQEARPAKTSKASLSTSTFGLTARR